MNNDSKEMMNNDSKERNLQALNRNLLEKVNCRTALMNKLEDKIRSQIPRSVPYLIPNFRYNKVALDWSNGDGGKKLKAGKQSMLQGRFEEEEDRILTTVILKN